MTSDEFARSMTDSSLYDADRVPMFAVSYVPNGENVAALPTPVNMRPHLSANAETRPRHKLE